MNFSATITDEDIPVPNLDDDDNLFSNQYFNSESISFDNLIQSKNLKLPHLEIDNTPRITCSQLATLLQDPTSHDFNEILILDARFPYEYRGGHILSSKNVTSQTSLKSIFNIYSKLNVCVICHCEFSKNRGPLLYSILRNHDRSMNIYPKLSLPEMYVLHGGYKDFYEQYPGLCFGGYTKMRDKTFIQNGELKRCNSNYIKLMKIPHSGLLKRSKSTVIYYNHSIESQKDNM